jgi:hypothetical protein
MGIIGHQVFGAVGGYDPFTLFRVAIETANKPVGEAAFFTSASTGDGSGHEAEGSTIATAFESGTGTEDTDKLVYGI